MITTSPPRKVIPEMTLSYYMLKWRHSERVGLVAHGPAHVAFMRGFSNSLCHKVSDHVKRRAKGGIDSTKFNVLTQEMNTHIDVTCSSLNGWVMPHNNGTLVINRHVGWSGVSESQVLEKHA